MFRDSVRSTRLLLWANVTAGVFLFVGIAAFFLGGGNSGSNQGLKLDLEARSAAVLLASELEKVQRETRAAAELATHIFTNPESYRLAAQPGEYDYDPATGLYGSARNDGSSVVFLSSLTALNPELLREIRLSEYLNPVFRTFATLNTLDRSISLYTTDGLVRSYPWFDFRSGISSGALKRNFSVSQLPFFAKAMPLHNPSKLGVWEVHSSGSQNSEIHLVCAAPFLAGEIFRGVIAVEVDSGKLATEIFKNLEPREGIGLLLTDGGWVLGARRKSDSTAKFSGLLSNVLKDLGVSLEVEPLLRRLSKNEKFDGSEAGFQIVVTTGAGLPVRPILIVPMGAVAEWYSPVRRSSGSLVWLLIGAGLAGGLFLADARWIAERRNLQQSERRLSDSLTALSNLNLQSALVATPERMLTTLYPKLDDGLLSIHKALETSPTAPVEGEFAVVKERVVRDLKEIEHQTTIFCAFDAADSPERNLNRLAAVLRNAFQVQRISFWSYSESALRILSQDEGVSTEGTPIAWKEGALFSALSGSPAVASSNSLILDGEELGVLGSTIHGSYLAVPLLDGQRLLGAVVLSEKASGISVEDEARLGALQGVLSRTIQNIYQCDGLVKLSQLRREYCFEFAKAVEAPLNRIRTEVQSIYARLGRLTPYYKQHCETILFEVGKLYEMLREAREMESEPEATEQTLASDDILAALEKKDRE